jgi:hypothetical protein
MSTAAIILKLITVVSISQKIASSGLLFLIDGIKYISTKNYQTLGGENII